jgi:hypothetical protein
VLLFREENMSALQFAYLANLVILVPVAVPTLLGMYRTDEGRLVDGGGWRVLVGSLWSAILILSALGLAHPLVYSPVLLLQLIYKSAWLAVFVGPRMLRGEWGQLPRGITLSFVAIVLVWPWLIPWSYLFG